MDKNADLIIWTSLTEAGLKVSDQKKKKIKLRLIKAGRSQRGNYYSPNVLEAAAPMFKGVKMYIDHPPEAEVSKPRSLKDWAGTILESTYDPETQSIDADVGIRSQWLWGLIEQGKEEEWLNEIGSSINAAGPTRIGQMDGKKTNIVEGIKLIRSVDFVPEASAGGQVQSVLEAKRFGQEDGTMELTLQELLDGYPKLVEQIQDTALEAAATDGQFIKGILESGIKSDELQPIILGVVGDDEAAMTLIVEAIEQTRTEQLGYNFDDLVEAVKEQTDALKQAEAANAALQESAGEDGTVDMPAFEKAVREDEASYWHTQYKDAIQESAAVDPEVAASMQQLTENVEVLTEENEQLRGDFGEVITKATAMSMLQESGLPEASCNRLIPQMIGKTETEMSVLIEDKRQEIIAIAGSTAVKGGSDQKPTPTDLKENAQKRIDHLFGYSDLTEAGKPKEEPGKEPKKEDLSHLE